MRYKLDGHGNLRITGHGHCRPVFPARHWATLPPRKLTLGNRVDAVSWWQECREAWSASSISVRRARGAYGAGGCLRRRIPDGLHMCLGDACGTIIGTA